MSKIMMGRHRRRQGTKRPGLARQKRVWRPGWLEQLEARAMLAESSGQFNGSAYVETDRSTVPVPTPNPGYTVEAWVKRQDFSRCEAVIASGYNPIQPSYGFWFGLCNGGLPYFQSNVVTGPAHTGNTAVAPNVWTHLAVTWSQSEERFYVNGELDAVVASGPEPSRIQSRLYVGGEYNETPFFGGPRDFFLGSISEARVWNVVRTQDDIRHSMHQMLEGETNGLLANWHLNGDISDTARQLPTTNLGTCLCGPAAPPVWRVTEVDANFNRLSSPRFFGAGISIATTNTAYLMGGYDANHIVRSEIFAMDMSTGDATLVGNLPFAAGSQAAAYVPTKNVIYLFGGEVQTDPQNVIVKFDPISNTAIPIPATLPTSLFFGNAVWHPGIQRIVLLGGYNGGALDTIYLFDPATETISSTGVTLPAGRYNSAVAYSPVTNHLYLFGGNDDAYFGSATREAFEIAIGTNLNVSVTRLPSADLPLGQIFASAMEDPESHLIYVLGGTAEYVQAFDPRTGKSWRTMMRMPRDYVNNANGTVLNTPYETVVYSSRNRHALVIGGGNYGNAPTNKVWRVPLGDGSAIPIERWDFINSVGTVGTRISEIDGDDRGVYFAGPDGGDQIVGIDENGNLLVYNPPGFNGSINDIAYSPTTGLWAGYSGSGGAWQFLNGNQQQFTPAAMGATNVYSVQPGYPFFGTDRGLKNQTFLGTWQTALHPNTFDYVIAQAGSGNESWAIVRNEPPVTVNSAGPWRLGHVRRNLLGSSTVAEFPSVCGDDIFHASGGLSRYNDITQDQAGNLWIVGWGRGTEAVCFIPQGTLAGTPSGGLVTSLLGNRAEAIDVDADNRVWVALDASNSASGGLTVYEVNVTGPLQGQLRNSDYNWLNAPIGSSRVILAGSAPYYNSTITTVAAVDEKVYAAKEAGGIATVAQRWQQIDNVLSNTVVTGIWTVAGRTFFASNGRLTWMEPDGLTLTTRNLNNELGLGGAARVVAGDGAGRIWVGTNVGARWITSTGFDDLADRAGNRPAGNVAAIVEGPDSDPTDGIAGPVWLGGDDGLTLFDRNRFVTTFTPHNSPLAAPTVTTILVDHAGNVWAGTTGGLSRLSPDRTTWRTFTTADGLPSNSIFDLAQLGDGTIAVSTSNGLTLYNGTSFTAQSPPINPSNLPLAVDDLGRLWAGSAVLTAAGWRGYWSTNSGLKFSTISDNAADGAGTMWFSHAPNPGVSVRGSFLPPLKDFTPVITSYSPAVGTTGTIMTINGLSLGSDPSEISVSVGGAPVDVVSVSETQVKVKLRDATTSGSVSLTRGGKRTSATNPFCAMPQFQSNTPTGGNLGIEVDIVGTNFDPDAMIQIGNGPARRADTYHPTDLRVILNEQDSTGQIVVNNHCAGTTVTSPLPFRKINVAIPEIVFNQGMPSSGVVEDKATLIQNYLTAGGPLGLGEKVEIDEVREYITDSKGFVRRLDQPLNAAGVTPPLVNGTPTAAERLTIANSQNVPNMFFTEPGVNTVRTQLLRRGRTVAEATTTVNATANQVLQVLLIPIMKSDSTPADLQTLKSNIDSDLAQVRERIFPFGTANVVWANEVIQRSDTFSLDSFTTLYGAAPGMDRVRRRYNDDPSKPDAQIVMGIVQPSLLESTSAPGFAFGADISKLLNSVVLDDLDTLCDVANGVVNSLSFGLIGSDDGCHLDIPLYVGWMSGMLASGSTLAHEIGHQLGLVKPWATNGSLTDNLSHSINDELPADMECSNWNNTSFDWNKSFYRQPGITRPIVDPIAGTEFTDQNDGNPNTNRAKAIMSYACNRTSANSFFEPVDVEQMNSSFVPAVADFIKVAKLLLLVDNNAAALSAPTISQSIATNPAALAHVPSSDPEPQAAAIPDAVGPRLHVFGTLDASSDSGELVRVESYGDSGPFTPSFATGYWLVQLDGDGNELMRTGVAPVGSLEQNPGGTSNEPTKFVFSATLRRQASAVRLELRHLDTVLDVFTSGESLPLIEIQQPVGGETFTEGYVDLAWTATDADGDPLEVSLEFSRDDGLTWLPIGSRSGSGAVSIPVEQLGGASGIGRFRVAASDGLHATNAVSSAFSVADQMPQVAIDAGLNGATVLEGKPLTLWGTATDPEDGMLDGASLVWVSSRDGVLGTGATLSTAILSVGGHAVTLFATDSAGQSSSSTIYVNIGGDYDFDGIDDSNESTPGLNPLSSRDAYSDADDDGLSLLVERQMGSNPDVADTDGDGRSDATELVDGTNAVAVDVAPAPDALSASVTSLALTVDFADGTALPQITVGVASHNSADWQLITDVDWLEATATTGVTPATTLIRVQAYKLTDGQHVAHLRFDSATIGSSEIIPFTVTVTNRAMYFDIDGNGSTGQVDCQLIQASEGLAFGQASYRLDFDIDRNGIIDVADLIQCNQVIGVVTNPGDFNGNGVYDLGDIDILISGIATGSPSFALDLTQDGVVNAADRDAWLAIAGNANLPTRQPYELGDLNLDGSIDAADAGVMFGNWAGSGNSWTSGDLSIDGIVDAADAGILFEHWTGDSPVRSLPSNPVPVSRAVPGAMHATKRLHATIIDKVMRETDQGTWNCWIAGDERGPYPTAGEF